jgi:hypothetical protein
MGASSPNERTPNPNAPIPKPSSVLSAFEETADDGTKASTTMNDEDSAGVSGGPAAEIQQDEDTIHDTGVNVDSETEERPPLPPRPGALVPSIQPSSQASPRPEIIKKPSLQAQPTIAISSIDIQTLSFPDGSRGTFSSTNNQYDPTSLSGTSTPGHGSRKVSQHGSEGDDTTSLMSYAPTFRAAGDLESLLGSGLNTQTPAWKLLNSQADSINPFETTELQEYDLLAKFEQEFDEVPEVDSNGGGNEGCCAHECHFAIIY